MIGNRDYLYGISIPTITVSVVDINNRKLSVNFYVTNKLQKYIYLEALDSLLVHFKNLGVIKLFKIEVF